jgi:hypothetical protein
MAKKQEKVTLAQKAMLGNLVVNVRLAQMITMLKDKGVINDEDIVHFEESVSSALNSAFQSQQTGSNERSSADGQELL